ncbi:MAG: MerR family transcriptional regulator [Oscillospiraceae bacterium]
MKINEVAKLTGVTVRTLHYYDEIGLLSPSEITQAGYRLYHSSEIELLQQILFFRELDFSLNDIKEIMGNPNYNRANALTKHRELLLQKRNRIDDLIGLVESALKGENDMSFKQFDNSEFEDTKKKYAQEVKERWENTAAYAESEEKIMGYDQDKLKILSGEGAAILGEFGKNRDIKADSDEAQALVKKWQDYITANFYNCTKEILSCLGLMYIADERFTQNIDKNGEGTAAFMAAAIEIYCSK